MRPSAPIEEVDLHALVDGQISSERRREVEDHLLQHPEDAALVENWRRQNAALRAAFEPVARETPPLSLRNAAARNAAAAVAAPPIESGAIHWGRPSAASRSVRRLEDARANRRKRTLFSLVLTLFAGAALAGVTVLMLMRPAATPTIASSSAPLGQGYVDRADLSYSTYAPEPVPVEIGAERKEDLLGALSRRVGFARVPDLTAAGLRLLGGRIAPGLKAPAGLLFYEDADNARLALYFERAEGGPAPRLAPRVAQGLVAVEWRAAGMGFVLIGPLGTEAMQGIAERAVAEIAASAPEPSLPSN